MKPLDLAAYTEPWDIYEYMGQHIGPGDTFAYRGTVYELISQEWNRATLSTEIEARNLTSRRVEAFEVEQDAQLQVRFLGEGEADEEGEEAWED